MPDGLLSDNICDLVRLAQAGSEEDVQKVYDRCRAPLLTAIRRIMNPTLRRISDSEDFLQESFLEIFRRKFSDQVLRTPKGLMAYMRRLSENKVRDANRKYLLTERYGMNDDVPLDAQHENALVSHGLSAADALALREIAEQWVADQLNGLLPVYRTVAELALKGLGSSEIARRLRMDRSDLRDVVERVKRKYASPRIWRKELTQRRKDAKKDRHNLFHCNTLWLSLRLCAFA